MFKPMDKEIIAILCKMILLNWPYGDTLKTFNMCMPVHAMLVLISYMSSYGSDKPEKMHNHNYIEADWYS